MYNLIQHSSNKNHIGKLHRICSVALGLLIALQTNSMFGQQQSISNSNSNDTFKTELPAEDQKSPFAVFTIELSPSDAKPGDIVTLNIEANVAESWHIYPIKSAAAADAQLGLPTKIVFETVGLTPVKDHFVPTQEPAEVIKDGEIEHYHEGKFGWSRQYRVDRDADGFSGTGEIVFQACDANKCVPPKRLSFQLGTKPTGGAMAASPGSGDPKSDSILIKTEICRATRPPATFKSIFSVMTRRNEKLVHKGTVNVEGQDIAIFLPKAETYTNENTAGDNTRFGNTSTFISIDQNGDDKLEEHEAAPANLPIRILNSMFKVSEIADDGSSFSLVKLDRPLSGVVLNRRCPDFSFETVDGKLITNTSILGKVTILDIWAVT